MALAFSISFLAAHPGLFLVLIGVIGEIIFDWPEMKGKRSLGKKLSAIILALGLVCEFVEAVILDNQVAETKHRTALVEKEAGQANLRAASLESSNTALSVMVEGLHSNNLIVEKQVEQMRQENLLLQNKMINGLYSRTIYEYYKVTDTNHVVVQSSGNSLRVYFLLKYRVVPNSIQGIMQSMSNLQGSHGLLDIGVFKIIRVGLLGTSATSIPSQVPLTSIAAVNNMAFADFIGSNHFENNPTFVLRYTADATELQTNLFTKFALVGTNVIFQ
jgi:hypothetical protein